MKISARALKRVKNTRAKIEKVGEQTMDKIRASRYALHDTRFTERKEN